jgi:hypothetical protein
MLGLQKLNHIPLVKLISFWVVAKSEEISTLQFCIYIKKMKVEAVTQSLLKLSAERSNWNEYVDYYLVVTFV